MDVTVVIPSILSNILTEFIIPITHNTVIRKPKINLNYNDSEVSQKSALSTLSSHKFSVGLKVSL